MEKVKTHEAEISVEERLRALYGLQLADSEIDKIKTLRGELPLEVQDLEDEIAGLETRLGNLREEVVNLDKAVEEKKSVIAESEATLHDRQTDLENKKTELDEIISDTQKEEEGLYKKSEKIQAVIEERLLSAYKRISSNHRHGLAVVPVQRDACGGCFT